MVVTIRYIHCVELLTNMTENDATDGSVADDERATPSLFDAAAITGNYPLTKTRSLPVRECYRDSSPTTAQFPGCRLSAPVVGYRPHLPYRERGSADGVLTRRAA